MKGISEMKEQVEKQLRGLLERSQQKQARAKAAKNRQNRKKQQRVTNTPELVGGLKLRPAAKYLGGIHTSTLRRAVERGLITPNRMFRHLIFPIKELDRFLREGQV